MKKSSQQMRCFKKNDQKPKKKGNNKNAKILMKPERNSISINCKQNENTVYTFFTKEPILDDNTKKYFLDFFGQITFSSKKNFQIFNQKIPQKVALQFGKINKDNYILQFRQPFNLPIALGVVFSYIHLS